MRLSVLVPIAAAAAFTFTAPASAALTITEDAGNLAAFAYNIDSTTRTITLWETWGPETLRLVDIKFDNFPSNFFPNRNPWTIVKYVTNNTGDDFSVFQHEVLNSDKSGSDNLDGLSFAQNGNPQVARISDTFDNVFVDELFDRDFLRFFDGRLYNGETARFQFGVTVTNPTNNIPFYLRQQGVIPEPATWAMLITGFGLVGFAMRRRKATVASVNA